MKNNWNININVFKRAIKIFGLLILFQIGVTGAISSQLKNFTETTFILAELNIETQVALNLEMNPISSRIYRRKTEALKGAGIGALSGLGIGVIVGLAEGGDGGGYLSFSAEEKAFAYGFLFLLPGALIGAIIGSQIEKGYPWSKVRVMPVLISDSVSQKSILGLGVSISI